MKDKSRLIWTPLQKKIFLLVVSLFSLVFALTLISIYQAAYNQAEREFITRLNVGKNVFSNEVKIAKQHLDSSVETVAKDWALRSAIGKGEDPESIKSVLFNHGRRINADIALVLNTQFMLIAQYGNEDMTVDQSLAQHLDEQQRSNAWITLVGNEPFMMSAEPIKAPATIGWLLMGKRLNTPFLNRVKDLVSLDINLAALNQERSQLLLSTANNTPSVQQGLLKLTEVFVASGSADGMHTVGEEDWVALPFGIFDNQQQHFVVVLQDSISAWLTSRNVFMLELLPFFIVGVLLALVGSFFIARSITRPVGRLLEASKLVASGSYTENIAISEKSELGELAREFGKMQSAVMEREQKIKDQAEEIRQTNTVKYQVEMAQKEQQLAASATEAKSRFLANVSHEIRTPLNSIIGYSEILSSPDSNKKDKAKAALAVHNGGQYLLNIVNDVLDLSKIEAGKIQLDKKDVSLIGVLDEVSAYMQGFAQEKKLSFKLSLNLPLPYEINTDTTRLKQILLNLCNNAIKFTEQGTVDLQVHLDTYKKRFIFVISDTGPGMSDEQQLRLFSAFSQGNQSTSRKYGGTGLGLYISKQLTEMLGGHIKVTSQLGEGSQFAVYMPWVEASDTRNITSQAEVETLRSKEVKPDLDIPQFDARILCADDNEDNRELVAYLIRKTGAKLVLVEDGLQAVKVAKEQSFDLVLMDMQMPNMDGLEATQNIIEQGVTAPIVMLTANADSASKKQMLAAGAKAHFAKPIDTQHFYGMLDTYLNDESPLVEQAPKASSRRSEFEQLVDNYCASFEGKLADIQDALDKDDWLEVKAMMHKLKGSAGSYGFQQISDFAILVEERIEQDNIEQARVALTSMQTCMQQISADYQSADIEAEII